MTNIEFEIKTEYSTEYYFLAVDEEENIADQIDFALANQGFCDNYALINIRKVGRLYMKERESLIEECLKRGIDIEEEFTCGDMASNYSLSDFLYWLDEKDA